MRNRRNKRKLQKTNNKIIILTFSIIFAIATFISVIFSLINMGNDKIIHGIKIEGIDVSNLNKEEVTEKLNEWYNEIATNSINLYYQDLEETINVEEIEMSENIDKVVEKALKIGRSGNIIKDNYDILFTLLFQKKLEVNINYNEEKLDKKIEEISKKLPGTLIENSYYIEGEELIIKKGQDGIIANKEETKKLIKEAVKSVEKNITIPVKQAKIEEIDINKIHNEIFKEPKDAYIETNPTKVYAHVNGVNFAISVDEINKILQEEKEEYIIPLKITIPEVTLDSIAGQAFPNKLSEFTTRYDITNKNRSTNLELSSEKVNGTIVLPGEIFSYNKIVGARTISAGYKEAAIYSGGKVVQGIGGGICQLSSTLYNAVLYANLEITSRTNHRFLTSYVQAGRDATVSWGTIDFCFKNTRNYPIKIVSSVSNGIVRVTIHGMQEENEYEVELQTKTLETIPYKTNYINDNTLEEGVEIIEQNGSNGVKSETYKILKQNGAVISKSLLSSDTYNSLEKVIRKGTKKVDIRNLILKKNFQEVLFYIYYLSFTNVPVEILPMVIEPDPPLPPGPAL